MKGKGKNSLRPKLTPVVDNDVDDDDDRLDDGLGFNDIVSAITPNKGNEMTMPSRKEEEEERKKKKKKKKKAGDRYRDPPSPKSILDRDALLDALDSRKIRLKAGQLDHFYRELHRSGYPPLKEFVAGLRAGGGGGGAGDAAVRPVDEDDRVVVVVPSFGTKNAISSRPGRIRSSKLPSSLLSFLSDENNDFVTVSSRVSSCRTSRDGSTTKIVVKLCDGHDVESVLMRHDKSRVTMCVSSQVGCAMGCTFCATGTMGMRGNLTCGEILEQLVHGSRILLASSTLREEEGGIEEDDDGGGDGGGGGEDEDEDDDDERRREGRRRRVVADGRRRRRNNNNRMDLVRNVVFMGMGEPLNNYDNVLGACRAMIDRRLWNLAHNRVTVSTVGVPSRMRDLTRDMPEVNLALSLHAPDQTTRERIVPSARGTPIKSLIEALDCHMMALARRRKRLADNPQGSDRRAIVGGDDDNDVDVDKEEFDVEERKAASKKKRAMIEYVMLVGDTTTIEAAHKLGKLCEGRHLVVNLIPYNKTDVKDKLSCPSEEHMREFQRIVSSYGSFCTIRRTMGADIAGACGQLVLEGEEEEKEKNGRDKLADIEDGPFRVDGSTRKTRPIALPSKRRKDDARETHEDESKGDGPDPWVRRLEVATVVAAICFVISGGLLLFQKRKHK